MSDRGASDEPCLTTDMLLAAYAAGYFPMAEGREDDALYWFHPEQRGVLPITNFNIPRGLKRKLKSHPFTIKVDTAFEQVIRACAETDAKAGAEREETWINDEIIALYSELHDRGYAHCVEAWKGRKLVGGLYGVSLGGAFFGESMFSRESEASKICLVYLVEILRRAGYALLDTQYVNTHLEQFGVQAMKRDDYMRKLESALKVSPNPSTRFATVSDSSALTLVDNSSDT